MQNALERFLSKNTIEQAIDLPVFHSTRAYYAKKILEDGAISPRTCKVFSNESLVYLFYGRPSYKMPDEMLISKYWQLPTVFIFDSDIANASRIFPFDTGAHEASLYPKFFSMIPRDEYQLSGNAEYPRKIISAFFVNADKYFKLKPRNFDDFRESFDVEATDEEIVALYDLISHNSEKADDRRFSIEIQTHDTLDLSNGKCRAIIMPEEYLESSKIMNKCRKLNIEVMSYPTFPLKQEMYYFAIYNAVYELYKQWGYAR